MLQLLDWQSKRRTQFRRFPGWPWTIEDSLADLELLGATGAGDLSLRAL